MHLKHCSHVLRETTTSPITSRMWAPCWLTGWLLQTQQHVTGRNHLHAAAFQSHLYLEMQVAEPKPAWQQKTPQITTSTLDFLFCRTQKYTLFPVLYCCYFSPNLPQAFSTPFPSPPPEKQTGEASVPSHYNLQLVCLKGSMLCVLVSTPPVNKWSTEVKQFGVACTSDD